VFANREHQRPVGSENPICMKSKDDSDTRPGDPDWGVTPCYITRKLETSLTMSRVFSEIKFLDHTRNTGLIYRFNKTYTDQSTANASNFLTPGVQLPDLLSRQGNARLKAPRRGAGHARGHPPPAHLCGNAAATVPRRQFRGHDIHIKITPLLFTRPIRHRGRLRAQEICDDPMWRGFVVTSAILWQHPQRTS
jgi:hypothetical protein